MLKDFIHILNETIEEKNVTGIYKIILVMLSPLAFIVGIILAEIKVLKYKLSFGRCYTTMEKEGIAVSGLCDGGNAPILERCAYCKYYINTKNKGE